MKSFYLFNSRALSHLVFWLGILFIYTFFPYIHQGNFWGILKSNLFYLPQDIVAVYFVLYFLFPKYLTQFKIVKFILWSFLAIIFLTTLSILVTFYLFKQLGLSHESISVKEQFSNSLFALLTITAIAATIKYVKLNLINQFRTAHISMQQMETELKYLRSQINPHFLFNSLNNIDELIYENQEKASKAIFHLSEILRYVLKESEISLVDAIKEIDFINNYIDFVRFSFKEKDFINCTINGDYLNRQVPPLLFIPIIENAIKYTDRKATMPGIVIKIKFSENTIECECFNKCSTLLEKQNQNGIGLKNLKRRLELIYPRNHTLDINKSNEEFYVKLKITDV